MFTCNQCGYKSVKWLGKCPLCSGWETFHQDTNEAPAKTSEPVKPARLLKDIVSLKQSRIMTGMPEFDRILGGGLVTGEIVLIGGEPGVGKSTLLLEVSGRLSAKGKTLYVSAEESPEQVALRARRLEGKGAGDVHIIAEDKLEAIFEHIQQEKYSFVVIDSIQVISADSCDGAKGSPSQIRGCADYLTRIAKAMGVIIFIVGHVTKEGMIAGPKLLEHIVDCVLYFEGEILSNFRILRAVKNRFGATGDIAVFEMKSTGLSEVEETSDIFLPHRDQSLSGSCVVCAIEGLRPLLIELQSLVSRASFGVVRRRSLGFDFNRFSLLVAIIEKRLKASLGSEDVFLNVAGGLKINDPAADLGAVMAIVSSLKEKEIAAGTAFIGEVGLAGELRRVHNINLRLKEVARVNFKLCYVPEVNVKEVDKKMHLEIRGCSSLKEVAAQVFK